ncbi:hypothetical protein BXY82_3090 [Gelidibacter sediminis]|uniref:UbiA prenyltransferase family protein n=1 Tax=Gelidibacter sediminis TaxID=1608710 RepID=A0A4R7PIR2_9FLAO|nr:hypothetical protein [Gelidibacter sediminis]TDU33792.1 hypothetical protein BXY82_3090 [Gelidibacter sediminis]
MKHLRLLLNFYVHSSIHVALAVLAMTYVTLLELDLAVDWSLLFFVMFSTITGYNFVKYFGLAKFHHRSLANWLKIIQVFSLVCFLLMIWFALQLVPQVLVWVGIFGLVTFLYAVPFLPRHLFMDQKSNLRNIGGIKVYVIAVVWAGVTVLLPVLNQDARFDLSVWITALQRFILVILLMLPFEIRDLQYDSLRLATIPQKIGVKNTKIIGIVLAMVFLMFEFVKPNVTYKLILLTMVITIITVLFIVFSSQEREDYYSSFWVEGVPIIWLILHFVF